MVKIIKKNNLNLNNNLIARLRYHANKIANYLKISKDIHIILIDDEEITKLNQIFFKKSKPTNVISFNLNENDLLGEVYISIDTAKREAKEWGVSLFFEIIYLIIHGILHLVGYNDLTPEEERIMEDKEIEIVNALKLKRYKNENKS